MPTFGVQDSLGWHGDRVFGTAQDGVTARRRGHDAQPARTRTEGACLALLWTTSGEYQRGPPTIPLTCLFSLQGFGEASASEGFTTDLYAAQKFEYALSAGVRRMAMSLGSGIEHFLRTGALGLYKYEAEASHMAFSSETASDSAQ